MTYKKYGLPTRLFGFKQQMEELLASDLLIMLHCEMPLLQSAQITHARRTAFIGRIWTRIFRTKVSSLINLSLAPTAQKSGDILKLTYQFYRANLVNLNGSRIGKCWCTLCTTFALFATRLTRARTVNTKVVHFYNHYIIYKYEKNYPYSC